MNTLWIYKKNKHLDGIVELPDSKSESNRVLIIRSLCGKNFQIDNLSESDDTRTLKQLLKQIEKTTHSKDDKPVILNTGNAGTVMRFLTAFLSIKPGSWLLTGSERMKERPVGRLVDALKQLGADITYLDKEGFPPLLINGSELKGKEISVEAFESSQFVTALMLIAPVISGGLKINLKGIVVSRPYLNMTIRILNRFGIHLHKSDSYIEINNQTFKPKNYSIEKDWSAAAYWYELVALSGHGSLLLKGLEKKSVQGDAILPDIFKNFGVKTQFRDDGTYLFKKGDEVKQYENSFIDHPDLAQACLVTCAGLNIPSVFYRLGHLQIKETDRIRAMMNEFKKIGIISILEKDTVIIRKSEQLKVNHPIETYGDHRMAMSFAPLSIQTGQIGIKNPGVVTKSYPGFFKELEKLKFKLITE